jgi:hypothetical protein
VNGEDLAPRTEGSLKTRPPVGTRSADEIYSSFNIVVSAEGDYSNTLFVDVDFEAQDTVIRTPNNTDIAQCMRTRPSVSMVGR